MDRITLRPTGATLFIILFLILAAGICVSILLTQPDQRADLKFVVCTIITIIAIIAFGVNYLRTRIVLLETELIYESLFTNKIIEYNNVKSINIAGVFNMHTFNKDIYLVIKTADSKINIHLKTYSRKGIKQLAATLIKECTHAKIDEQTRQLVSGKFPRHYIIVLAQRFFSYLKRKK